MKKSVYYPQEVAAVREEDEPMLANEILHRSLQRLSEAKSLDGLLDILLSETVVATGAASGAIHEWIRGTECRILSLTGANGIVERASLHSDQISFRATTAADPLGVMRRTLAGECQEMTVDEIEIWFPEAAAYHRERGHQRIWHFPYRIGGRIAGFLGLAYVRGSSPTIRQRRIVEALAYQTWFAIEALRLGNEARDAAVAQVREEGSRHRETELLRINQALSESVAAVSEAADISACLDSLLLRMSKAADAPCATFFEYDAARQTLCATSWVVAGKSSTAAALGAPPVFSEPFPAATCRVFRELFQHKRLIYGHYGSSVFDGMLLPGIKEWHVRHSLVTACGIPVLIGSEPAGIIWLASEDRAGLGDGVRELLQTLANQVALALRLQRLAREAREAAIMREREHSARLRAEELAKANETLRNALAHLAQEEDLPAFLETMLREALRTTGAHSGAVVLIEGEPGAETAHHIVLLDRRGVVPSEVKQREGTERPPFNDALRNYAARIAESDGASACDPEDEIHVGGFREFHRKQGNKYIRNIALRAGKRMIGWLGLGFEFAPSVTDEHLGLLRLIADQITMAVELIRLGEQAKQTAAAREREHAAQRRAQELSKTNKALRNINEQLSLQSDPDSTLPDILHEICRAVEAPDGGIFEYRNETEALHITAGVLDGERGRELPGHPFGSWDTPCPVSAFSEWQKLVEDDAPRVMLIPYSPNDHGIPDSNKTWHARRGHRMILQSALIQNGRPIGLIGVIFREERQITESEMAMFNALTQQVVLAMRMARLSCEAKAAAVAKERELAAKRHVALLVRTNEVLRNSLAHLANDPDLQSFLMHLLVQGAAETGAVSGHLFTFDSKANMLRLAAGVRNGHAYRGAACDDMDYWALPFPADITPAFKWLCDTGKFLDASDEFEGMAWPGAVEWFRANGYKGASCLALKVGARPVGMLGLIFNEPKQLSTEEMEFIKALANQGALAIEFHRLSEEAEQTAVAREQEKAAQARAAELARANDVLQETLDVLATEPEIESSLGHVLRVITEQLGAFSSALWLRKGDFLQYRLRLIYCDGVIIEPNSNHLSIGQCQTQHDPVWTEHIEKRRPILYDIQSASHLAELERKDMQSWGVKAVLGVPLLLGREAIGSFIVRFADQRNFSPERLELIQALAHQATLAVKLTHLAHQAQQKAQESATLEERNRLAREIHDTIAQGLTGVISQLEVVEEAMAVTGTQAASRIAKAKAIAKASLSEARRSVWALRPAELESQSLLDALKRLVSRTAVETGLSCRLDVEGEPYPITSKIELDFYRVAQEGIRNVIKHAEATRIDLTIQFSTDQVCIKISDDGCGFQRTDLHSASSGFGLISMRERAEQAGGSFSIRQNSDRGTTVEITISRENASGASFV